jgi:hypothetical protein
MTNENRYVAMPELSESPRITGEQASKQIHTPPYSIP